jgi:shikimate dehydrogenase
MEMSGTTTLIGLLGWPTEQSLSPTMQNAAFAAYGLDWTYVPLPTRPEDLAAAIRGLAASGFAGANVTAPHKRAAAEVCGSSEPSVNTLVVKRDTVEAISTDTAILARLPKRGERHSVVIIGDGGAATAFLAALPHARCFSRRGMWPPPKINTAELVINATPERDVVLIELGRGQTLIDLPYPETATARAAREAGATVIEGLEVLVAQGAASFEAWTGMDAPIEAMRLALGLPV